MNSYELREVRSFCIAAKIYFSQESILFFLFNTFTFSLFSVKYEILDSSKDGVPIVKVDIPDSMPDATVQYDSEAMAIHVKDPSLGWVARVGFVRDLPDPPDVFQVKNGRKTRVSHSDLEDED